MPKFMDINRFSIHLKTPHVDTGFFLCVALRDVNENQMKLDCLNVRMTGNERRRIGTTLTKRVQRTSSKRNWNECFAQTEFTRMQIQSIHMSRKYFVRIFCALEWCIICGMF